MKQLGDLKVVLNGAELRERLLEERFIKEQKYQEFQAGFFVPTSHAFNTGASLTVTWTVSQEK